MKKVLGIVGPTAVGKTSLSVQLAKRFSGEIISGDSMQVYRTLDIGTAKVTEAEMEGIPHHLIDVRDIAEGYSAADFQRMARPIIADITARGRLPIIVGGTGLYIQSLLWDYQLGKAEQQEDAGLREKYAAFAEEFGKQALWEKLAEKDSLAAEKIHFNNVKKVIRALEVIQLTGHSILMPKETPELLFDAYLIGLDTDRELLYKRINQRVDLMMAQGVLGEAKQLFDFKAKQAAQGIGYKEFFPYFEGRISLEQAIDEVKRQSRRYAKRQLTWFRNRMPIHWYDVVRYPEEVSQIESAVTVWLKEG